MERVVILPNMLCYNRSVIVWSTSRMIVMTVMTIDVIPLYKTEYYDFLH